MLIELSLENFTLVDSLQLKIPPRMTALTGETGAGKSLLVDALTLLLGARMETSFVRHQKPYAHLRAVFQIPLQSPASQWLKQNGYPVSNTLTLERRLQADGKSKAILQNIPCPLSHLKQVGSYLLSIQGQQDHHLLLDPNTHGALLDTFGEHDTELQTLKKIVSDLKEAQSQHAMLLKAQQESEHALRLLDYQIQELEASGLNNLDIQALDAELNRLTHAITLQTTTQTIANALIQDEDALTTPLQHMLTELSPLIQHDANLQDPKDRLQALLLELRELGQDLGRYSERIDFDPERLAMLETQFSQFSDLARKHRVDIQDLPNHLESLLKSREGYQDLKEKLVILAHSIQTLEAQYKDVASLLSDKRAQSARVLSAHLKNLLPDIAIPQSDCEMRLTPRAHSSYHPNGVESCELWISTNPGQPLKPLAQVVSGGELSRIHLAFTLIMHAKRPLSTYLFDEVDVGISGAVAEKIGRVLHRLSIHSQVICITHLPQVAALAHHHFQIQKHQEAHHTYSTVIEVKDEARVNALAALMGGVTLSETTRTYAQSWLKQAAEDRKTQDLLS